MTGIKTERKNRNVSGKNAGVRPSVFSFFSGAGFLDLGFETNGFDIVFVNEFHKPFMDIYRYSREKMKLAGPEYGWHNCDISVFLEGSGAARLKGMMKKAEAGAGITGFIGGPPCPDFSVAGKNRGREGENGKLSGIYVELICRRKPSFFLFENVKGLWRTAKHRAFYEEIKQKLQKNGYAVTERLINSIEYGVPQNRERIIMIGFKRNLLRGMNVKPGPGFKFPWEDTVIYKSGEILSRNWPDVDKFGEDSVLPSRDDIQTELTVEYWFRKNGVYSHPNADMYFRPREGIKKFLAIQEGDDSKKSFKRLHRWRYSPAAAYGNNEVHLHPYKARRISVSEALAIQSLPEKFVIPDDTTLTNAFKSIGNGVPFLAAAAVAESLIEFIGGKKS